MMMLEGKIAGLRFDLNPTNISLPVSGDIGMDSRLKLAGPADGGCGNDMLAIPSGGGEYVQQNNSTENQIHINRTTVRRIDGRIHLQL